MARMIPNISEDAIANSGERTVYRELRDQLPKNWVVRYHYPVCWKNGTRLLEREGDFIVIAPGLGIMFLEVKGSYGYQSESGIWYRLKVDGSREVSENPFDQVSSFKHRVVQQISTDVFHCDKASFPGVFGHAVVYPHAKVEGHLPGSVDPEIMIGYRDIKRLKERLESAYHSWGAPQRAKLFTSEVMVRTERFLADECRLVPVLASTADADESQIKDLTLIQYNTFRGLSTHPRVHVFGTAGSGKTILAIWSAQTFVARGERTLFVCFNRTLAAWIRHKLPPSPGFDIRSFFSLCREVVTKAGLQFNVPTDDEAQMHFWGVEAPALFCTAIEQCPETILDRYDAVVVDEAQDFHQDWWFPLQLLLRDPDHGHLCVFSDPKQAGIYGQGFAFPEGLLRYDLMENCRNTKRITQYLGSVLAHEVRSFPNSPIGIQPTILQPETNASDRARVVRKAVIELIEEGFSPSRIAILSPWRRSTSESSLSHLTTIHSKALRGDEEAIPLWADNGCIWASTIKAFKGLEADCIILSDVPASGIAHFHITDLYVAASRAKHLLYIIPSSSQAFKQLEEWSKATSQVKPQQTLTIPF